VTFVDHLRAEGYPEFIDGELVYATEGAERLRYASQKDGTPLFDIRHRKHGPTWVRFDPRVHPYAGVGRVS
jgi:hypothetical protein